MGMTMKKNGPRISCEKIHRTENKTFRIWMSENKSCEYNAVCLFGTRLVYIQTEGYEIKGVRKWRVAEM